MAKLKFPSFHVTLRPTSGPAHAEENNSQDPEFKVDAGFPEAGLWPVKELQTQQVVPRQMNLTASPTMQNFMEMYTSEKVIASTESKGKQCKCLRRT